MNKKKRLIILLAVSTLLTAFLLSRRFPLRIMAIYLLPNIYLYRRLRVLFIRAGARKVFPFLFVALTVAFPASELLSHANGPAWLKIPLQIGYLALPFLLYLLLLLAVSDILLGLNRLVKIIAPDRLRTKKKAALGICLLFLLSAAIVFVGIEKFNRLRVNGFHVQLPAKSSTLKTLRIVLAADFHLGVMTAPGFMAEFAGQVNALKPDIVLIPGDIINDDHQDTATAEFARQFRGIKAKYGIVASPGNHEARNGVSDEFFTSAGITMLRDKMLMVDGAFILAGRNDRHSDGRLPLGELLRGRDKRLPLIVLDHRPNDIVEASRNGVDMQLSGHSHHGQLFPFNLITRLQYPLSWGYKKIGGTHFFVTCGVQVWGPQVRTAGVSEIMLIEVDFVVTGADCIPNHS